MSVFESITYTSKSKSCALPTELQPHFIGGEELPTPHITRKRGDVSLSGLVGDIGVEPIILLPQSLEKFAVLVFFKTASFLAP